MSLWAALYDPSARETRGERVQAFMWQAIAVWVVVAHAFRWAFEMSHHERVVKPLGLARYVDVRVLFDLRFGLANAALVTALALVALFSRHKALYLAVVLGVHLQHVARYSLGKTGHGSHFAGLALLFVGIAHVSSGRSAHARRIATGLTLFFYGLSYTMSAVIKLVRSGPMWIDGRHLWLWMAEKQVDLTSEYGQFVPSPLQALLLESRSLATALLTFGLLSELFAFLLWWKRTRPFLALALTGMHLGVMFTLDIHFIENCLLLLGLGLPIAAFIDRRDPEARESLTSVTSRQAG
jgi:hypothetical protein